MGAQKIGIVFRLRHFFTYHPWLKLISLLLAIVLWLYVKGESIRSSF